MAEPGVSTEVGGKERRSGTVKPRPVISKTKAHVTRDPLYGKWRFGEALKGIMHDEGTLHAGIARESCEASLNTKRYPLHSIAG
jgi:hypothetical protein